MAGKCIHKVMNKMFQKFVDSDSTTKPPRFTVTRTNLRRIEVSDAHLGRKAQESVGRDYSAADSLL